MKRRYLHRFSDGRVNELVVGVDKKGVVTQGILFFEFGDGEPATLSEEGAWRAWIEKELNECGVLGKIVAIDRKTNTWFV